MEQKKAIHNQVSIIQSKLLTCANDLIFLKIIYQEASSLPNAYVLAVVPLSYPQIF